MDLRNNQITVGELLANPAAHAVLARRFPGVIHMPIVAASRSWPLEKAIQMASAYVSRRTIQETLLELRTL